MFLICQLNIAVTNGDGCWAVLIRVLENHAANANPMSTLMYIMSRRMTYWLLIGRQTRGVEHTERYPTVLKASLLCLSA